MEIKFITGRENHQVSYPRVELEECKEFLRKLDIICLDTENSSLFPLHAVHLLLQVGNTETCYVIDRTSVEIDWLKEFQSKTIIGANLKYDYEILKTAGIEFRNMIDVMVTEQTSGMGTTRKNSLDAIIERRLNTKARFDKSLRNEFINGTKSFVFHDRHIEYAADDIQYLLGIRKIQKELIIDKLGLGFLLDNIEFPLMPILGDAELRGINFNIPKWRENIIKNKKKKYEIELKLDEQLTLLSEGENTSIKAIDEMKPIDAFKVIKGGRFSRKRNDLHNAIQPDIFGNEKIIKVKNKANVNWGSPTQVKDIFRKLGQPLPIGKEKKESIGVEYLKQYLIDYPKSKMYRLVELLIEYSDVTQKISAFGQGHIDIVSPVSGRIHTIYTQAGSATGRFRSGNMEHGMFNSQQIPADNDYRDCFYATPGYKILTIDLSSAELIILGSLAKDPKLLELQSKDIHSYLAIAAYNNILLDIRKTILARKEGIKEHHIKQVQDLLSGHKDDEKITFERAKVILENFMEGEQLTISKKKDSDKPDAKYIEFGWLRDAFKNVVYGLIYGATAKRISEVLGINTSWATVVLKTLRAELPVTFAYLDGVAAQAVNEGYVILSERTKARRWFQNVLDAKKNRIPLSNTEKGDVEREAKNAPIQSTNAWIVKEAIVRIANEYIRPNNLDAHLIMQVHDELVYEFKEELEGTFDKEVHRILTDTASRYLAEGVSMGASYHVMDTWHK